MLNHYVLFKYRDGTPSSHVDEFCQRMLALKPRIAEIAALEIGLDILQDQRSWDVILAMKFESVEALRNYQGHPDHRAVMAFNDPRVAEVASLDYEIPVAIGRNVHPLT